MENQGKWMSILEYASFRDTSISTIRRHIKSKRVESKKVDGKYFIFVDHDDVKNRVENSVQYEENLLGKKELELQSEINHLKTLLTKKEEELNDLKMLVEVYESKTTKKFNSSIRELPEIPVA